MREKSIEEYMSEMMKMYNTSPKATSVPAVTEPVEVPDVSETPSVAQPRVLPNDGLGSVIVVVTGGNSTIPLKGATVTIYDSQNGEVIERVLTDESGKTAFISLPAPLKSESLVPALQGEVVFAIYDIKAEAEGYITDTKLNVPIFDDTVSIQQFNLVWLPASSNNVLPTTEDEGNPYTL